MVSERIENFLKIISEKNPELNAVLSVNNNAANETGKGALEGRGIIVKANICVEGMESNCASKALEGFSAPYDATVIRKLKAEGAVILGMANCDEFASGSTGENSAFGPAQNPAAPGRVPGGSSSGSAVAVAAGMCDAALGSETGGSIRNPASHCGVIGFKPSYGAVSRHGLIDLSMSLDAIGVFARDAKTLAKIMKAIAGPDENDARTLSEIDMRIPKNALKGTRIGIVPKLRSLCADERIYEAVDKKVREYAEFSYEVT